MKNQTRNEPASGSQDSIGQDLANILGELED